MKINVTVVEPQKFGPPKTRQSADFRRFLNKVQLYNVHQFLNFFNGLWEEYPGRTTFYGILTCIYITSGVNCPKLQMVR